MKIDCFLLYALCICSFVNVEGQTKKLPEKMIQIIEQPKYQHAHWGIFAKDAETGKVLCDLNSHQLFLPGSVSKLFSVSALLHAYGDDFRFKTPVYITGKLENGTLKGDVIIVGQGDLTMGGRQGRTDQIDFTKMDHIYANDLPGAILTKENPLHGFKELAKQMREKGIKQIDGNILVDDRLFEKTEKRGMILTPLMINENLIDILINPALPGQLATLNWRPMVPGYTVINKVKTGAKDESLQIQIQADPLGRNITVEGTIPADQINILRNFAVKDPRHFAWAAFVQALQDEGMTGHFDNEVMSKPSLPDSYGDMQSIAVWTSPPLSEYAKLILKVSHNLGADLVPLLLASQKGAKTFDEGMLLLGKFIESEVGIERGNFVFVDAAGGDSNRLTPQATLKLLDYIHHLSAERFQKFYLDLPILGVDGSLADFGKNTDVVGKVYAKTGTGVAYNLAIKEFFLTTQTLAGYIKDEDGHLIEFMIAVNNAQTPEIKDVLTVFEDQAQLTALIFDFSKNTQGNTSNEKTP